MFPARPGSPVFPSHPGGPLPPASPFSPVKGIKWQCKCFILQNVCGHEPLTLMELA